MNSQKSIQKHIEKISTKYILCRYCSLRLKCKKSKKSNQKCFICKNIFEGLDNISKRIFQSTSHYEFASFETGIIIKPSLIDRDDHIKSKFQIKGVPTLLLFKNGNVIWRQAGIHQEDELMDLIKTKINI